MSRLLTVAPSPHNYSKSTIKSLMYGVIIALIPTLAVSLYFFGLGALIVTLTAIASAMLFEYLISKFLLRKEPTLNDGSEFDFSALKGKKVILVNSASDCGYTGQYEDLQQLYEKNNYAFLMLWNQMDYLLRD